MTLVSERAALPRSVFPTLGETFSSWMLRLADTLDRPPTVVLQACGLLTGQGRNPDGSAYGVHLTPERLQQVADITRADPTAIQQSLLTVWDGGPINLTGYDLTSREGNRQAAMWQWAHFSTSFACADCLTSSGYRWQTTWRLPWHYLCPTHKHVLVAACPQCEQPLHRSGTSRWGPAAAGVRQTPSGCSNAIPSGQHGVKGNACAHPLTDLPHIPIDNPAILATQQRLLTVLNDREWDHARWNDLRIVTAALIRHADTSLVTSLLPNLPDEIIEAVDRNHTTHQDLAYARAELADSRKGNRSLTYRNTPADPALLAPTVALALTVVEDAHDQPLTNPDVDPMNVLTLLTERRTPTTKINLGTQVQALGGTAPLVASVNRTRTRNTLIANTPIAAPSSPPIAPVELHHIPRLWWDERYQQVAHYFEDADLGEEFARAYLSLAAARTIAHQPWATTAQQFDWRNPNAAKSSSATNISRLRKAGHLPAVEQHIHTVMQELAATDLSERVNYQHRRKVLADIHTITADQWHSLTIKTSADTAGDATPALTPTVWRLRSTAAWLWRHHGLNPLTEYPGFDAHGKRDTAVEMYRRFTQDDLPTLEPALQQHAHLLAGEPADG